jgi:NADH-quinone oxidoreductase subunit G
MASPAKKEHMIIDGIPIEIEGEKNILDLVRKAGIDLPTFCYHSELSIYGACRMCMIETEKGGFEAACSTPPAAGMSIKTNTERLRRYRKMILELLLANHRRDCTSCEKSGRCRLQELAERFGVGRVRFPDSARQPTYDLSSPSIIRDESKCILCGNCVRVCNEVQAVGAIDFTSRGQATRVNTVFGKPIEESPCVSCGQCAAACPTGALRIKSAIIDVWKALDNKNKTVSVQIAPAVRAAVSREFGLRDENAMGRIVAALRRMGFDKVCDTAIGADLTVIEEAAEFVKYLEAGKHGFPLFTSCCPAWVHFAETRFPEIMPSISTARSPMQMFAAVLHEEAKQAGCDAVHVAVMPCSAKKMEAVRKEFTFDGKSAVDYVLTTQELVRMIRESGIVFNDLESEAVDMPFSTITGAGVIFGVTGGVTEAVLRHVSADKSPASIMELSYSGVRGMEGVKTASLMLGEREVRIAMVSGLGNAAALLEKMREGGEEYRFDFVEVMACPGGCVGGAGQPESTEKEKKNRGAVLYAADRESSLKRSEENPIMKDIYDKFIKGRAHELLHVHYGN